MVTYMWINFNPPFVFSLFCCRHCYFTHFHWNCRILMASIVWWCIAIRNILPSLLLLLSESTQNAWTLRLIIIISSAIPAVHFTLAHEDHRQPLRDCWNSEVTDVHVCNECVHMSDWIMFGKCQSCCHVSVKMGKKKKFFLNPGVKGLNYCARGLCTVCL